MSLFTFWKNYRRCQRQKKSGLSFPVSAKIHGVKICDHQGALAQSAPFDELQLVHVALDDYPNNVYVYSIPLNSILGHLDEELSKQLIYVFGYGFCLDGEIDEILGGPPYKYFGARIFIHDDNVMMENCEFSHLHSH